MLGNLTKLIMVHINGANQELNIHFSSITQAKMNFLVKIFSFIFLVFCIFKNAKGNAIGPLKNADFMQCPINGICRSLDEEKANKSKLAREEYLDKNKKLWEEFEKMKTEEFEVEGLGIERQKMKEFLADPAKGKEFMEVFIYLTQLMEKPICLTLTTIQSIAALNGQQEEAVEYLVKRLEDGARKSRKLRRIEQKTTNQQANQGKGKTAFIFEPKGIAVILVREDGLKCGESLLKPKKVAKLMERIMGALGRAKGEKQHSLEKIEKGNGAKESTNEEKEKEETGSFNDVIEGVMRELKNGIGKNGEIEMEVEIDLWIKEMNREWGHIQVKLVAKKIGHEFKDFAIWLFKPSHVVDVIQILLFLSGYGATIQITIQALQVFGIEEMFARQIEKMGVKIGELIGADGKKKEVIGWAFGPNGVVPRLVRGGGSAEMEEVEKFKQSMENAQGRHAEIEMEKKAEIEFLKKIMEEVIEHKGKPMHELMDHLMEKLHKIEEKLTKTWKKHVENWKGKWAEIKERGVKENLKKFAVWLFTPERINNVIMLIFAITNLDTPVFLTLETLEAFGISDLFVKSMERGTKKMEKFYERHPTARTEKEKHLVEFMIGKDGILPLFLKEGEYDKNDAHLQRLEDEADIIEIVASVLTKKASARQLFVKLYGWVLEKVQNKGFYLEIVQRWNKTMEEHHQKLDKAKILKKAREENEEDEKKIAKEENGIGNEEVGGKKSAEERASMGDCLQGVKTNFKEFVHWLLQWSKRIHHRPSLKDVREEVAKLERKNNSPIHGRKNEEKKAVLDKNESKLGKESGNKIQKVHQLKNDAVVDIKKIWDANWYQSRPKYI